ncbi:MAG: hypothetical protein RSE18_11900, partial [Acinetobacter sp.]
MAKAWLEIPVNSIALLRPVVITKVLNTVFAISYFPILIQRAKHITYCTLYYLGKIWKLKGYFCQKCIFHVVLWNFCSKTTFG